MKTYRVLLVKHRFASYNFAAAEEVEAEGPSQAVEKWAKSYHTGCGHTYEHNTVRVWAPDGEAFLFDYTFFVEPVVLVQWDRSGK